MLFRLPPGGAPWNSIYMTQATKPELSALTTGRLAGKTAVITGIAGGQGRAAALAFAAEGAQVIGCDLDAAGARETVEAVRRAGGCITSTHPIDLTDEGQVRSWADR